MYVIHTIPCLQALLLCIAAALPFSSVANFPPLHGMEAKLQAALTSNSSQRIMCTSRQVAALPVLMEGCAQTLSTDAADCDSIASLALLFFTVYPSTTHACATVSYTHDAPQQALGHSQAVLHVTVEAAAARGTTVGRRNGSVEAWIIVFPQSVNVELLSLALGEIWNSNPESLYQSFIQGNEIHNMAEAKVKLSYKTRPGHIGRSALVLQQPSPQAASPSFSAQEEIAASATPQPFEYQWPNVYLTREVGEFSDGLPKREVQYLALGNDGKDSPFYTQYRSLFTQTASPLPNVLTIIMASSLDRELLRECVVNAVMFSNRVFVAVGSHLFDGSEEPSEFIFEAMVSNPEAGFIFLETPLHHNRTFDTSGFSRANSVRHFNYEWARYAAWQAVVRGTCADEEESAAAAAARAAEFGICVNVSGDSDWQRSRRAPFAFPHLSFSGSSRDLRRLRQSVAVHDVHRCDSRRCLPRDDVEEWTLLLDADEIMDGRSFLHWLQHIDLESRDIWTGEAYLYGSHPSLRLKAVEFTFSLYRSCVLQKHHFFTYLDRHWPRDYRYGLRYRVEHSLSYDVKPMCHHYTILRKDKHLDMKARTHGDVPGAYDQRARTRDYYAVVQPQHAFPEFE